MLLWLHIQKTLKGKDWMIGEYDRVIITKFQAGNKSNLVQDGSSEDEINEQILHNMLDNISQLYF